MKKTISKTIFREYDIRGTVNKTLFENDVVSEEVRREIEEAWEAKIKENKGQRPVCQTMNSAVTSKLRLVEKKR